MSRFEKATRLKLRFGTAKGMLSTEDLWDLLLKDLNVIAKSLNKKIKEIDEEDFLEKVGTEEKELKLGFEIVLHVLEAKKKERDNREKAEEKRVKKAKLLALLEKKQDEGLEGLSEEEIKAELDNL